MNLLCIFGFGLWLYLLTVLYRARARGIAYLWGVSGFLIAMIIWIKPFLEPLMIEITTYSGGLLGNLLSLCRAVPDQGLIWIYHQSQPIAFYVDYECSGILEVLAFTALLWFFPLYSLLQKVKLQVIGIVWILCSNSLRIWLICLLVSVFGYDVYYVSHTVLGRILYFLLSTALYFYLFTVPQIKSMKKGGIRYADET